MGHDRHYIRCQISTFELRLDSVPGSRNDSANDNATQSGDWSLVKLATVFRAGLGR
jgi:hypothetical protein